MKRSIGAWEFLGFGVVSLLGTLLHFLYEWTGENAVVAVFSGVNESTWEHMKLLFFPMLFFAVAEYFFFRERTDFWCIKLRGTLAGLIAIPVLFYTYNGVIGRSPDWINIAIFFVSAAIGFWVEYRKFRSPSCERCPQRVALAVLCVIALLFAVFTFYPPHIGLFRDPLTGGFGRL